MLSLIFLDCCLCLAIQYIHHLKTWATWVAQLNRIYRFKSRWWHFATLMFPKNKIKFADIVIRSLQEKRIILVVVLTFGLVLWTIVISSVLQDHTAQLQHAKFLAIRGTNLSQAFFFFLYCSYLNCINLFCCKRFYNSIITYCYFTCQLHAPNTDCWESILTDIINVLQFQILLQDGFNSSKS